MKRMADKKMRVKEFVVGELVYLKLQLYKQNSLIYCYNHKPTARYYDPYKILQKVGKIAYKLERPLTCKIHPTFHVS